MSKRRRARLRRQILEGRKTVLVMLWSPEVGSVIKLGDGKVAITKASTRYNNVKAMFEAYADGDAWRKITPDHEHATIGECYIGAVLLTANGLDLDHPVFAVEVAL